MRSSIFFISLIFAIDSLASFRVGNGGDVVVCKDSIRLLDFYEASFSTSPLDIQKGGRTKEEMLSFVLNRLKGLAEKRADKYLQQVKTFFDESVILRNVEPVDIPDSLHVVVPKGCAIKQAIIQQPDPIWSRKRYNIYGDLWNQLDELTKAGLILHEVIYRDAIDRGHKDSTQARVLTALISSSTMEQMTSEMFLEVLYKLNFYEFREGFGNLPDYH